MGVQKWIDNLRNWIDEADEPVEQHQPRPRSKWEDFLVAIAREVEQTMLREMFTPPGGPTYIPREYVVFLSAADDAEWRGEKREGLERGLHHVLSERARELVGEKQFQTRSFAVELRVDGALETGKFRVQHVWDAETEKTMVKPRRAAAAAAEPARPADEEATVVKPRKQRSAPINLLVRRGPDETPSQKQFFKEEITIGRGSRVVDVDLKLEGDPEVSRKHATLIRRDDGVFTITCHGANPITIGDVEVQQGDTAQIEPGSRIAICSHELTVVGSPQPIVSDAPTVEASS